MASSRRSRPQQRPAPKAPRTASQGGRYPSASGAARPAGPGSSRTPGAPGWTTPGGGAVRTKVELASRTPLLRMHAAPRWLLFLVFLGLAIGAALAPSVWGALCALVLAVFLAWLGFLAWPRLTPGARTVRVLVVAVLIGAAGARLLIS